jgi:hypothetical protein
MTITYEIQHADNVIAETWQGDITIDQLRAYWREILSDPEVMKIRRTLVDVRFASIGFSDAEFDRAVSDVVFPALEGRDWITAIVVNTSRQLQLGSRYHSYAARYSSDVIFSSVDDAKRWLLKQHRASSET